MNVAGGVVVITGGGGGIGAALARRFAAEGAAHIVVADRDSAAAEKIADEVSGTAATVDVRDSAAIQTLVDSTLAEHGQIDLFCSNAGIFTRAGLDDIEAWQRAYEINVLAHVAAARAVVPSMVARGRGYLLNTASAAGLLTAPGDGPYAVTKHAAVALAEWLSVTYGDQGIGVSVICPFGVATPMLLEPLAAGDESARVVAASGEVLSPEAVADAVVEGLARETFLIVPHPKVAQYWAQKASDPDRWLAGVRRLISANQHG